MNSVVDGYDLSGTTLDDRYRLERRLGQGAMGQVYVAHQTTRDRPVAVKVLHPWLASEPKHRQRFLRAARAAKRIEHPNVVEILDFGTVLEGPVYLVMERLEGRDLGTLLEREGALPWTRARHLLLQAVAALREAHRQEVIHRDIKPANCFVCEPDSPGEPERMKLLDFGIAKVAEEPSASTVSGKRLTQTGELVGTLAYLAPEFADGEPASVHSDMYALGIMAYQLVTGEVPFTGRNEFQVLARHLKEPPVRPRVVVPELPEAAEFVLLTMLAKKPELRFECMDDVEQALRAIPSDGSRGPALVVPRRQGSGRGAPLVRPREPSRPRASAARVEPRPPAPSAALDGRPPPRAPLAPGAGEWAQGGAGSAVAQTSAGGGPPAASESSDVDAESPDLALEVQLPRREWGTTVTVIVLVVLSVAAIVSVFVRQ